VFEYSYNQYIECYCSEYCIGIYFWGTFCVCYLLQRNIRIMFYRSVSRSSLFLYFVCNWFL